MRTHGDKSESHFIRVPYFILADESTRPFSNTQKPLVPTNSQERYPIKPDISFTSFQTRKQKINKFFLSDRLGTVLATVSVAKEPRCCHGNAIIEAKYTMITTHADWCKPR